jgi:hypothetical protein
MAPSVRVSRLRLMLSLWHTNSCTAQGHDSNRTRQAKQQRLVRYTFVICSFDNSDLQHQTWSDTRRSG